MKFVTTKTLFFLCISLNLVLGGSFKLLIEEFNKRLLNGVSEQVTITTLTGKGQDGKFKITGTVSTRYDGEYKVRGVTIRKNNQAVLKTEKIDDGKFEDKDFSFTYTLTSGVKFIKWIYESSNATTCRMVKQFMKSRRTSFKLYMEKKTYIGYMRIEMDMNGLNKLNSLKVKLPKMLDHTKYYKGFGPDNKTKITAIIPQKTGMFNSEPWFTLVMTDQNKTYKRKVYPYKHGTYQDTKRFLRAVQEIHPELFEGWHDWHRRVFGVALTTNTPKAASFDGAALRTKKRRSRRSGAKTTTYYSSDF